MSAPDASERAGRARLGVPEVTKSKTGRHAPRTPRVTVTDPDIEKCSGWMSSFSLAEDEDGTLLVSIIDASGNTVPGKWLIYAHVAAPTQGGIVNQ